MKPTANMPRVMSLDFKIHDIRTRKPIPVQRKEEQEDSLTAKNARSAKVVF
jgi:hypothetical protein